MKAIGIIDDRDKKRKAFANKIALALDRLYPEWKVIDSKPFIDKTDYNQWILENGISVLILDEQLNAEAVSGGKKVNYSGHQLVKELRKCFKNLPIYSITSIPITSALKRTLRFFNLILSSRTFDENLDVYLNLLVKSGINFYEEYERELARLSELSEKIANGSATKKERAEAGGIQTNLQIPHLTEELQNREEFLSRLESQLQKIENLNVQIAKLLK